MNKGRLTYYFRKFGLIMVADKIKFALYSVLNYRKNKKFKTTFPDVVMPPDYMIFESFKLDYEKYYLGGQKTAEWICSLLNKYGSLERKYILDWGCGPARVTRHLPTLMSGSKVYGTDYNPNTITWCNAHIPDITFVNNTLNGKLNFEAAYFDGIIGISIFTHLSEENHRFWIDELHRVLKKDGIAFLTTAGEAFKIQMTDNEISQFEAGHLVLRGNTFEGHRTFAAFQPKTYFTKLLSTNFDILEFKAGTEQSWGIEQDYWILKSK